LQLFKDLILIFILLSITPAIGGGLTEFQKRLWYLLIHFKGDESTIDDPRFFLHKEGKKYPLKELQATVEKIKRNPRLRCKFPARAFFIEHYLKIDLPEEKCPQLEKFLSELEGSRISLVFADSHINSPASMFGHTFIRIFKREGDLYSYIVNYAAHVDDPAGLLYAFKGIFGFYRGYYSVAPFYSKIKEYSGIEGRDLWEYELKIDKEHLYLLKLHLWELKKVYAYYYFFNENCSTEVFFLLNFTDPSEKLELTTPWTVPTDTIKALIKSGRVVSVRYEPSLLTKLKARERFLKKEDIILLKNWIRGKSDIPENRDTTFYEFAADYLRFLYYGSVIDLKTYRGKYLKVLRIRSRKPESKGKLVFKKEKPHLSHNPQRFSLSIGYRKEGYFTELAYRPVYHDLLDRSYGYKKNAEIIFSEIALRFFQKEKDLELSRWKFIRIVSLEPILSFYKPISWKVDFGLYRTLTTNGSEELSLLINTGGGYTLGFDVLSVFILPDIKLTGGEGFYGTAVGTEIGILSQNEFFSLLFSVSAGRYLLGFDKEKYLYLKGGLNIPFLKDLAFRTEGGYKRLGDKKSSELRISFLLYF